ncbi:MAG TPA: PaaI family thioesterase [Xanthobacteraceae bacterium]|nr:PaaI family thioesterase [Xanthobacteraceae bacterium]
MDKQAVAEMLAREQPAFGRLLGAKIVEASADRLVAELTVREQLVNRNGVLAGGAVMAVADNLGGTAAVINLPPGATTATIESKTNFFAACRPGEKIRIETTPLHRGRSTMVWQSRITRADGTLAALVTQTQIVMPAVT